MIDKQIIEEDMVNAKDFCPHYSCQVDCYEARMCQWFVDTLQQLKTKEQECEKIKNWVKGMMFDTDCSNWFERFTTAFEDWKNDLISQLDQLKTENEKLKEGLTIIDDETLVVEITKQQFEEYKQLKEDNEKMEKGYIELTEIVSPYIDDFTGYNEELKGFDIVLCVKELMQQLDQLKADLEKEKALKQTYLSCYKTKHGDVKGKLFKYEKLKQSLLETKEIAEVEIECKTYEIEHDCFNQTRCKALNEHIDFTKQILQKCNVLNDG